VTSIFESLRFVPGHVFDMGSERFYPEERPVRSHEVAPFRIAATPTTNDMFQQFVNATGYVTTAEQDSEGAPGALVFAFHEQGPADWRFVEGACWHRPWGPTSNLDGLAAHPVVQVSRADAEAFAAWADLRLPSEVEWEAAARGGLSGLDYAWGDKLEVNGAVPARTWNGEFPAARDEGRHSPFTAPVGTYAPNGFGLFDTIGNVWELTADIARLNDQTQGCCRNGLAPEGTVIKGGSHLCAPNYCRRYRPAARQIAVEPTSHIGFRCAA
jgi:formylglycine-generating enzyme